MSMLGAKVASLVSPRALCDRITADVARDCESARAVFPEGEPHQWLQLAYMARMNRGSSLLPTDVLRATASDETLVLSTLPWPDCARALGFHFFKKEHAGVGGKDAFIAAETSAYFRLLELHASNKQFHRDQYAKHNPKLAAGARSAAPSMLNAAEKLSQEVIRWSNGDLSNDELFAVIAWYQLMTKQPPAVIGQQR